MNHKKTIQTIPELKKSVQERLKTAQTLSGKSKDANTNEKLQANYKELSYQLMILNEAESVLEKASQQIALHNSQAYQTCACFYKGLTATNGPGTHKNGSFRDSIRKKDIEMIKQNRLLVDALVEAFQGITPNTLNEDEIYQHKLADLMNRICSYVIYHRQEYATAS